MTQPPAQDEVVYTTKWFDLVARHVNGSADPHYLIKCSDFVVITALNVQGELLLVRQLRPAIGGLSLELPSGHVDPGETPEQAARRELLEETGYVAGKMELLTTMAPGIGRLTNQMWCYFAPDARPVKDPDFKPEAGVELVRYGGSIRSILEAEGFCSSLSCAALLAAVLEGKVSIRQ
jgi:ADP-ribose pyrophosphatase YjhB (NUDIX family)